MNLEEILVNVLDKAITRSVDNGISLYEAAGLDIKVLKTPFGDVNMINHKLLEEV